MAVLAKLSKEIVDKLREPVFILDESEVKELGAMMGVDLIAGTRDDLPEGYYAVSRLALANTFINDAHPGLRIALTVEDDGTASDVEFHDYSTCYKPEDCMQDEPIKLGSYVEAKRP